MLPPKIPTPLTPLQVLLRVLGLLAVLLSLLTAFQDPFGPWHWLLLLLAGLLLWAARRGG